MKKLKAKKPEYLLVVAHPDDEILFFTSVLFKYAGNTHIICVTDGNADGLGAERKLQFEATCKKLKVKKSEIWNLPDHFEQRLIINEVVERLTPLQNYKKIFTHGILGEYGHPHHQDVSLATHLAFNKKSPVYSVAYNNYPDFKINLSRKQYDLKMQILTETYYGEIRRFLNYIPATFTDGFTEVKLSEIKSVYELLSAQESNQLTFQKLKSYRRLQRLLVSRDYNLLKRPF
jgi:LmbE family N-acetylglucosaminyl deacetylase